MTENKGDLISREALKEDFKSRLARCNDWIEKAKDKETKIRANAVKTFIGEVIMTIDNAPTVEEVRKMNNECFTEQEKIVLRLMFMNFSNILESCGGYIDIDDMGFSRNDLYSLFLKIGIGDFWD